MLIEHKCLKDHQGLEDQKPEPLFLEWFFQLCLIFLPILKFDPFLLGVWAKGQSWVVVFVDLSKFDYFFRGDHWAILDYNSAGWWQKLFGWPEAVAPHHDDWLDRNRIVLSQVKDAFFKRQKVVRAFDGGLASPFALRGQNKRCFVLLDKFCQEVHRVDRRFAISPVDGEDAIGTHHGVDQRNLEQDLFADTTIRHWCC